MHSLPITWSQYWLKDRKLNRLIQEKDNREYESGVHVKENESVKRLDRREQALNIKNLDCPNN